MGDTPAINEADIISDCKAILGRSVTDVGIGILSKLEHLREPLMSLRVANYKALVLLREQYRMPNYPHDPKDKATPRYTDFDRKIMLDAQTAEAQAAYDEVAGLELLVSERIALLRELMK